MSQIFKLLFFVFFLLGCQQNQLQLEMGDKSSAPIAPNFSSLPNDAEPAPKFAKLDDLRISTSARLVGSVTNPTGGLEVKGVGDPGAVVISNGQPSDFRIDVSFGELAFFVTTAIQPNGAFGFIYVFDDSQGNSIHSVTYSLRSANGEILYDQLVQHISADAVSPKEPH